MRISACQICASGLKQTSFRPTPVWCVTDTASAKAVRRQILILQTRKKMGTLAKDIPWVKVMLALTGWILWLMEHCVKYISKLAYIQVVLTNESFFPSAWNAFTLMIKHCIRFGMGAAIGKIFMVFGCLVISGCTGASAYFFISNYPSLGVA